MISVSHLTKHYQVHKRQPGIAQALRSLWKRQYESVRAVDDISFSIAPGERVGFLGPNGAGKTTTLKMLSGLLHPTSGGVSVLGHVPALRSREFLSSIMLVTGQKQQLIWDLPPAETFELNRAIYGLDRAVFKRTLDELVLALRIDDVMFKPTRQLSLGERMKCELAAALLHRPRVLFLDEPTIGLDVTMQGVVRGFIKRYNEETGASVLLTSHDMDDVAALCPRIIVIDHGRLIFDGTLSGLVEQQRPEKRVTLRFGFMETPDVPLALQACAARGLEVPPAATSFFLSRETIVPTAGPGMAPWRERLFATMSRNAGSVVEFFRLPDNAVVELGTRVQI